MASSLTARMAVVLAASALASTAAAGTLDGYRWEKRLLLAFAPTASGVAEQQAAIAVDRAGFLERDLVLIAVTADRAVDDDGAVLDAAALRRRFGVADGRRIALLVGKDGGEKLRVVDEAMTMDALFAAIDVMPMRRREMLDRRN